MRRSVDCYKVNDDGGNAREATSSRLPDSEESDPLNGGCRVRRSVDCYKVCEKWRNSEESELF